MNPQTAQEWIRAFFESRWTGHLSLGAIIAAVAWVVGSTDALWSVPPDKILVATALGVAGFTYSCDHALTKWMSDDE